LLEKFLDVVVAKNEVGTKTFPSVDVDFTTRRHPPERAYALSMTHTMSADIPGNEPSRDFIFIGEYQAARRIVD